MIKRYIKRSEIHLVRKKEKKITAENTRNFLLVGVYQWLRRKHLYPAETQICQRPWVSLARNQTQLPRKTGMVGESFLP